MKTVLRLAAGTAVAILGVACAEIGTPPSGDVAGALAAFESVPAGFSSTSSTFAAAGDLGEPFQPRRVDGRSDDRDGRGGDDHRRHRDWFGFLMGGGLGPEFFGLIGYGPGLGRGPFQLDSVGSGCVYDASTGIVTCGPVIKRGLTILVTASIKTAAGDAQPKFDSLTNSVRLLTEVRGTLSRRDSATSTLNHRSARTVTGLAKGSTRRTVDGTSVGTETTIGTTDAGDFDAIRTVNDTTAGIVIPLADRKATYPVAGRVSRNMTSAITVAGTTTAHSRSEVVTYDGSATATVVITQDGVTKTCALPLPRGKLVCR